MLPYAKMYHGTTELKRLYRGSELIWEKPAPHFTDLNDYLDYYYAPERSTVWERPGFAAYISGLWGLLTALFYTDEADTSLISCAACKYLYDGGTYNGTVGGYTDTCQTSAFPMARAQHFAVSMQITADNGVQDYTVEFSGPVHGINTWLFSRVSGRLRGTFNLAATGILSSSSYSKTTAFWATWLFGTMEQARVTFSDGDSAGLYFVQDSGGMPYPFGAPVQVTYPAGTVTGSTLDSYIRNVYNAAFVEDYPALVDLLFVPPEGEQQ